MEFLTNHRSGIEAIPYGITKRNQRFQRKLRFRFATERSSVFTMRDAVNGFPPEVPSAKGLRNEHATERSGIPYRGNFDAARANVITADYIKEKGISLFKGNCLEIMPYIDNKSIDLNINYPDAYNNLGLVYFEIKKIKLNKIIVQRNLRFIVIK